MYPRIMVTGIPSYLSNLITRIEGLNIHQAGSVPDYRTKASFMRAARGITNTGNYLIGEGAMDALPRDRSTFIPFWHFLNNLENPEFFRQVREDFDVCVFTAANLIRRDLSAEFEALVLERIGLPVIVLGIGIQRQSDLGEPLPEGTQTFISLLAERNAFVFARGEATAQFLQSQDVHNAKACGCPSMYHLSENVVRAWKATKQCRLGPSSRLVFSGYFGHESHFHTARDINRLVEAGAECAYVLQDEMVTYGLEIGGDDNAVAFDPASGRMIAPLHFPHQEKIRADLKLHCFFDTNQWRAWLSCWSFALQRRFHGSMVALQAGVPSLMIALDDRMREMLDFIGFPYLNLNDWIDQSSKADFLNSFMDQLNVSAILDKYSQRELAFRAFLRDAGVAP